MRYYPIFLDLGGRRCAVVGGGPVAERKVKALFRRGSQRAGHQPRSYAASGAAGRTQENHSHPARVPLRRPGRTHVCECGWFPSPWATLVFAATNSPETQKALFAGMQRKSVRW